MAAPDDMTWIKLIWSTAIAAFGFGGGFFVKAVLSRYELEKIKNESAQSAGELLKDVQAARRNYSTHCLKCLELARTLTQRVAAKGTKEELAKARDALCSAFTHEVITAYLDDMEFRMLEREKENDPDEMRQVCIDGCDELARFVKWLQIINAPFFVEKLELAPLRIQERTFRPINKIALRLPAAIKNEMSRRLESAVDVLVNSADKSATTSEDR